MDFGWLKKYLPRSLFGRALLIMLVPLIGLQLVVGSVFIQRHYRQVTEQMTHGLALELNYALDQITRADTVEDAQAALDEMSVNLEMLLLLGDAPPPLQGVSRQLIDLSGSALIAQLQKDIHLPFHIDLKSDPFKVSIWIETDKGTLEALIARSRLSAINPHQLLVVMIGVSVLLVAVSMMFLRLQVRPIKRLARAAEALGKGQHAPLHPSGSTEVRRAALAFIAMRAKLEQQIEERTRMLSAVSHDLRTPLTRMKLALEMMEDSDDLRHDLADMEAMLNEFLAFSRDEQTEEATPTDPEALLADIAARCDLKVDQVRYETSNRLPVVMRADSVRRAVQNLIENAKRYGDKTRITMILTHKFLEYRFEDNGPGIPPDQRENAIKPFTRLDPARNQDAGGGFGLGLSIASDIAKGHGGMLVFSTSDDLGGLCASFRIPR